MLFRSAVKGQLFKLMRPALCRETDLREQLGKVKFVRGKEREAYKQYEGIVKELEERMLVSCAICRVVCHGAHC